MESAGMRVLEGDADNYYHQLTSDDTARVAAEDIRHGLEHEGVPVDEVLSNMVSYQTVRSHLNDCLDIDTSGDYGNGPDPKHAKQTVRKIQSRTKRIVGQTIERLSDSGKLSLESPSVNVVVTVTCEGCGRSYRAHELMEGADCECADKEAATHTNL